MTKAEIYEQQVKPLMAQIYDICKEHELYFTASFQKEDRDENGAIGLVTSQVIIPDADGGVDHVAQEILAAALIFDAPTRFAVNTIMAYDVMQGMGLLDAKEADDADDSGDVEPNT